MISVDIILCCYNQEQYIAKAVESILNQNIDGLSARLIVADDYSTDSTLSIIRSYEGQSKIPFVYLSGDRNLGLHKNYQRAFAACSGKYIAILEGDDWWSSDMHLRQHIDFLETHKNISMTFNRITFYKEEEQSEILFNWPYPKNYYKFSFKDQILWGNVIGNLSACVFRTDIIKQLPEAFFKLNFADWELGIWSAQWGDIAELKDSTSVYRFNESGQWSRLSEENKRCYVIQTLTEMNDFFNKKYNRLFDNAIQNVNMGRTRRPYMSLKSNVKFLLRKLQKVFSNDD